MQRENASEDGPRYRDAMPWSRKAFLTFLTPTLIDVKVPVPGAQLTPGALSGKYGMHTYTHILNQQIHVCCLSEEEVLFADKTCLLNALKHTMGHTVITAEPANSYTQQDSKVLAPAQVFFRYVMVYSCESDYAFKTFLGWGRGWGVLT